MTGEYLEVSTSYVVVNDEHIHVGPVYTCTHNFFSYTMVGWRRHQKRIGETSSLWLLRASVTELAGRGFHVGERRLRVLFHPFFWCIFVRECEIFRAEISESFEMEAYYSKHIFEKFFFEVKFSELWTQVG